MRLNRTFFRVQSVHPYIPLSGTWYAFEADNSYGIYQNGTLKRSYSGIAKGFGKVRSVFNEEYIVYVDSSGSVRYLSGDGRTGILTTLKNYFSVVCFGDCFFTCQSNSEKTQLTVSKYIIVGAPEEVFTQLIGTKTLDTPVSGGLAAGLQFVKQDESIAFITNSLFDSAQHCVKLNKGQSGTTNDFSMQVVDGYIPAALNRGTIMYNNSHRYLYAKNVNYLCTIVNNGTRPGYNESLDLTIKRKSDNVTIYSGHIDIGGSGNGNVTTRIYLGSNGNGYVTIVYSSGTTVTARLYSLTNGVLNLITSQSLNVGTAAPYSVAGSGIMPLINNIIPPILVYVGGSVRKKVLFTTNSVSFADVSNSDIYSFGCAVLELE